MARRRSARPLRDGRNKRDGEGRMADRRDADRFGRWAESLSVLRLRLGGYRILARRFRCPAGEIDLIARRGALLAMIEVKARSGGDGLVSRAQSRRIEAAALAFLARHPRLAGLGLRYDIMLVGKRRWPRHLRDAWRPVA